MGFMTPIETNCDPHIRAINLRTDLASIANLVELSFSDHMDMDGRDYLRNMRQIARSSLLTQYAGTSPETSAYPFHGYIWEEDGSIVGNLTLIYMRKKGRRVYFIANVATHPEYRGRGIARQLTERALAHVREHNGTQAFLQVRDDNPTALRIYQSLGFEERARRTTWKVNTPTHLIHAEPGILVRRRKKEDWLQQKFWLSEIYPPSIAWNLPFQLHELEPGIEPWLRRILNGEHIKHWSVVQQERLLGVLTWQGGPFYTDPLWLATSPAYEHEAIRTLIPKALQSIPHPGRIMLNYPAGRGVEAFHQAGMKEHITLIWMEREISPMQGL